MQSPETEEILPEKVTAPPKKEVVLAPETDSGIRRSTLVTAVSVTAFSFLLILLFMAQRSSWHQKIDAGIVLAKKAELSEQAAITELNNMLLLDSQQVNFFHNNYFDAYDEAKFRIYGLFYDTEKKYSTTSLARKFNVTTPGAIIENSVAGERRFIIPVKAVHYIRPGETVAGLAKKYYHNHEEAAVLITDFNAEFVAGKTIFIPFN